MNFMSNTTVTRLREIVSHSRETLTRPDPFTEVMHFRKKNTTLCSAIPFTQTAIWMRKKQLFLVLKKVLDAPAPIRTRCPGQAVFTLPPSSSSSKCKRMAEMELLPSLTGREQRPQEIDPFILPGAQGLPDTMADPLSHLPSITPLASENPYSGLCQRNSQAQTIKGRQNFLLRGINISCLLVFLPCCYQSENQQQHRRLTPHSLPSSNEGERGDGEIRNMLIFIKIHELN